MYTIFKIWQLQPTTSMTTHIQSHISVLWPASSLIHWNMANKVIGWVGWGSSKAAYFPNTSLAFTSSPSKFVLEKGFILSTKTGSKILALRSFSRIAHRQRHFGSAGLHRRNVEPPRWLAATEGILPMRVSGVAIRSWMVGKEVEKRNQLTQLYTC